MRPFDIDVTPEYVRNYWALEVKFGAWMDRHTGRFLLVAGGEGQGPWQTYREALVALQRLPADQHHALIVLLDLLPTRRSGYRRLVADSYRRTATPAPAPLPLSVAARENLLLHYGFADDEARTGARSPWLRGELAIEALRNDPSGSWEGRYVLWAGDHLWGAFGQLEAAEDAVGTTTADPEVDVAHIVTKLEEKHLTPFARAVVQTYRRQRLERAGVTAPPIAEVCAATES
ncbi:MAG TPA: hypothetical protein VIC85_04530 [Ktedonobacterales bacterium]